MTSLAERRARHKVSLRQEILNAARQMFVDEGYDQVSMRKLAQKIEYSPTTIYLHFEDKDDLFRAVCDETFAKLARRLDKQRRQHANDPLTCLTAGLREYMAFGLQHPDHYIVTFMHRARREALHDYEGSAGQDAFGFLSQAVADCAAAGLFRPMRVEVMAQVLWVSIHGLVSLLVAKKAFPFVSQATLIDAQLDLLVRGLLKEQTIRNR
jgi:AcrR family transcriptional regulator